MAIGLALRSLHPVSDSRAIFTLPHRGDNAEREVPTLGQDLADCRLCDQCIRLPAVALQVLSL